MTNPVIGITPFNGKNDFNWKQKEKCVYNHQKVFQAVEDTVVDTVSANTFARDEWVVESCYSYHMSPHSEFFTNLRPSPNADVLMANNKQFKIEGLGDVCLRFSSGTVYTLKNVRFVPSFGYNLISCTSLENEGLEGRWGKGIMKILKGSLCLFKAERKNCFHVTNAVPISEPFKINKTLLWHNRLGHMSVKGLRFLKENEILSNSDIDSELPVCKTCSFEKPSRVSFPAASVECISRGVLEYLHMDVWGPSIVSTHGGCHHFLVIVDDFSLKTWCFLLKNKSEVVEKITSWKVLIENETNRHVKAISIGKSLEFCYSQLSTLCSKNRINLYRVVPNSSCHYGIAQRVSKTILDRVHSLLSSSGLDEKFWGEALYTASYLINRSPSIPLKGKCPESIFSRKRLDISHLRTFGCSVVTRQKNGIFLGYSDKGYRVWLRDEPGFKVTISWDVIFKENVFPCLESLDVVSTSSEVELPNASSEVELTNTRSEVEFPYELPSQAIELETRDDQGEDLDIIDHIDCRVKPLQTIEFENFEPKHDLVPRVELGGLRSNLRLEAKGFLQQEGIEKCFSKCVTNYPFVGRNLALSSGLTSKTITITPLSQGVLHNVLGSNLCEYVASKYSLCVIFSLRESCRSWKLHIIVIVWTYKSGCLEYLVVVVIIRVPSWPIGDLLENCFLKCFPFVVCKNKSVFQICENPTSFDLVVYLDVRSCVIRACGEICDFMCEINCSTLCMKYFILCCDCFIFDNG